MREFKCARCGRREACDDRDGWWAHRDDDARAGSGWAALPVGDVCPQCQTEDERRQARRDLVLFIEEAIRSRSDGDADPSAEEVAIINLAMRYREEMAPDSRRTESVNPAPATRVPPDAHRTLTVAITGAFLTGCPLRIGIDKYRDVQAALVEELRRAHPEDGWVGPADSSGAGTYTSGGGYATEVPLILVRREGDTPLKEALDGRKMAEYRLQESRIGGWNLDSTSLRIEVYDLGVGVIDAQFTLIVPHAVPLAEAAAKLKQAVLLRPESPGGALPAVPAALKELAIETTAHFRSAVARVPGPRLLDPWPSAEPEVGPDGRWGRLLWLHPVHLLAAAGPQAHAGAAQIAPVFSAVMDIPGGLFVPGIGWSAVVTTDGSSGVDLPMRLLRLHWAFIALYMEIDRGLLTVQNQLETTGSADVRRPRLRDLEGEATRVFDSYTRVVQARSRVDSTLAGLGGDEQAVWDKMTSVTKYDTLVDGVGRKVEALRHITERRVQEASAAQARRSSVSLGLLTTLGLVTLSIAAVGYFFGSLKEDSGSVSLRVGVFAAGLLFAVVLWWAVFLMRPRLRRRHDQDRPAGLTANPAESSGRPPA